MRTLTNGAVFLGLLLCSSHFAKGQEFINLDFESAVVRPTTPTFGFLDWSVAAPGWGHSDGGDTSIIYYGSRHLGSSQAYLLVDAFSPTYAPGMQLAGRYSLAFSSGIRSGNELGSPWINAYISQTGLVPLGTESLHMLATGPFAVYVGGINIPMLSLGNNEYAGDISGFDGTVTELKIVNTLRSGDGYTPTLVDNIGFSVVSVPEPSTLALGALAGALLIFRLRKSVKDN